MKNKNIFLALDTKNINEALDIAKQVKDSVAGIKLGLEFFSATGPDGVKKISKLNIPIFLDLKYLDIKNTIIKSIKSLEGLPIKYLSIHTLNGKETLIEAKKTANELKQPIKLLGITILTSFSEKNLSEIGFNNSMNQQVEILATLAQTAKLDGIVCSPHEIDKVKKIAGNKLIIVTPGIRQLSYIKNDDQKRFMSPAKAVKLGADYLVIGRPISKSLDPLNEIKKINFEIEKSKN